MAGSLHYIPLKQRDYLSSEEIMALSDAAQGVLMRLLCFYWDKGSLTSDVGKLAALVGRERKAFEKVWREIEPLWRATEDGRIEPWVMGMAEDRAFAVEKVEKNRTRKGDAKGGRPRGGNQMETELKPGGFKLETELKHKTESESELDTKRSTPLLDPAPGGAPLGERVPLDEERFEAFFRRFQAAYPKRGDGNYKWPKTKEALHELLATRKATAGAIMDGLTAFKAWAESGRNADTEFVPSPPRWLDDSGWLDEYPTVLAVVPGGKSDVPANQDEAFERERRRMGR